VSKAATSQVTQKTEIRKLTTLLSVSQTLGMTLNLRQALTRVLEILEENHGVIASAIVLRDEAGEGLTIEASAGLSHEARQRARYRVGEGIIGRVVESGKPVIVPKAGEEPLFLDRAGSVKDSADERTFICVPLSIDRRAVGAMGIVLRYKRERDYDQSIKFFSIVGSMIAQAVKVNRLIESEKQRLVDENLTLKMELRERYDFSNIVGTSRPMQDVYAQVAQVARTNTTVLIRGESGTGKELIARAIHYNSLRAAKPFVKVSCAALPESLIEAELFGHEKGAFTGAHGRKKGRFELADRGTLFLDEIGDLSPSTQVKILRVLQEREFERLGGTDTIKVDVRLIAATNRDLEEAIRQGTFREDLYYRFNVFTIFLPPLRERKSDALLLADHFLEKYARLHQKDIRRISTPAIDMLTSYHWPGNVRELENCIERAVLICEGNVIHGHHLPPTLQTAEASGTVPRVSLAEAVEAYEKDLVLDALKTARGNITRAARLLSTTKRILGYKVKRYGISPSRFKE
jgi:Nif-specific regulatory protein